MAKSELQTQDNTCQVSTTNGLSTCASTNNLLVTRAERKWEKLEHNGVYFPA